MNRPEPRKRKPYRKGWKADYRGATPRQVAEAVRRYRGPGKPARPIEAGASGGRALTRADVEEGS